MLVAVGREGEGRVKEEEKEEEALEVLGEEGLVVVGRAVRMAEDESRAVAMGERSLYLEHKALGR